MALASGGWFCLRLLGCPGMSPRYGGSHRPNPELTPVMGARRLAQMARSRHTSVRRSRLPHWRYRAPGCGFRVPIPWLARSSMSSICIC
jgi:hypothetical protein